MREPFLIDFIRTVNGPVLNVIYRKVGACAPGILLARSRQASES